MAAFSCWFELLKKKEKARVALYSVFWTWHLVWPTAQSNSIALDFTSFPHSMPYSCSAHIYCPGIRIETPSNAKQYTNPCLCCCWRTRCTLRCIHRKRIIVEISHLQSWIHWFVRVSRFCCGSCDPVPVHQQIEEKKRVYLIVKWTRVQTFVTSCTTWQVQMRKC